tara:strand:+ start:232 stop:498 length:267 start_codon:yes stop_codon:yes gene_type:complete
VTVFLAVVAGFFGRHVWYGGKSQSIGNNRFNFNTTSSITSKIEIEILNYKKLGETTKQNDFDKRNDWERNDWERNDWERNDWERNCAY